MLYFTATQLAIVQQIDSILDCVIFRVNEAIDTRLGFYFPFYSELFGIFTTLKVIVTVA